LIVFDVYSQEVDVVLFELTFVDVEVEVIFFYDGEDFIDYPSVSSYVFFLCFPFSSARVYGHIVHVYRQVSTGY
jgi:hypothetical protein